MKRPMDNSSSKNIFKTIKIIYTALLFGVFTFTVLGYTLSGNPTFGIEGDSTFLIAIPVVALAGYMLGNLVFNSLVRKSTENSTLTSKLTRYQSAILVRIACLEAPAFLAIVATFITSNAAFLLVSLLMLVLMYLQFPSKEKFKNAFTLTMKEKSELDKL